MAAITHQLYLKKLFTDEALSDILIPIVFLLKKVQTLYASNQISYQESPPRKKAQSL